MTKQYQRAQPAHEVGAVPPAIAVSSPDRVHQYQSPKIQELGHWQVHTLSDSTGGTLPGEEVSLGFNLLGRLLR